MQNFVLNLQEADPRFYRANSSLSFKPFVDFLKQRASEEKTVKARFYDFVLEKFEAYPELQKSVAPDDMVKHKELLELVYGILVPPIADENKTLWALAKPLAPVIFYGTDAFYNLIADGETHMVKASVIQSDTTDKVNANHALVYSFLLRKLYNFNFIFKNEVIHSLHDKETGIIKYYKMNLDERFITVTPNGPLPKLDLESIQLNPQEAVEFSALEKLLPLEMFCFEGVSVLTLTEVTGQYAIETIKNIILSHNPVDTHFDYGNVIHSLKALAGNSSIEFGLLPLLKINNKLIFNDEVCMNSALIGTARIHGMAELTYMSVAEKYLQQPRVLFYRALTEELIENQPFLKILKMNGIKSYALIPVYYNNKLTGVLEIYSKKEGLLEESFFTKLDSAIPLLAQLLRNSIEAFDGRIDAIIREKFTSLQPAVQWKFNDTAWHYLRDSFGEENKPTIEPILFKDVYPIYGAIDIRNSTVQRSEALRADMHARFALLVNTLQALKDKLGLVIIDEKIFLAKKWERTVSDFSIAGNESGLNHFLETEMHDFLLHFKNNYPQASDILDEYLGGADDENGVAHRHRKELESSMQQVNNTVNNYLEKVKGSLQQSYPCYFEKFRSDGIEYDIYIGQSIAPDIPFNLLYFHNLRLWQLNSMAEIARLTNGLLEKMKKPLETTQLIFIHPNTIDISFRTDERRFDVEGAYNIRYQVVKKRIDKVRILNTNERLTQPGKIAMVYFNHSDAEEYVKYIQYMQEQGILQNDLERLELETLQGVSGLKALRVGVNMDYA
jgi:hypothetical protein